MFRQPLGNNEMVVSITKLSFAHAADGAQYVIVGTVKDWQLNPKVDPQFVSEAETKQNQMLGF